MYNKEENPGQRIRRLREAAGLSPDELAEKTGPEGPSAHTIARIEAGVVRPFSPFLSTIARALDVTEAYIMSGRSEPQDAIAQFAERHFVSAELRQEFVAYARGVSFRQRNLNQEELFTLKREFDRRRGIQ